MKNKYALGDLEGEIQRLSVQASFFEPMTKSILLKSGLKKGMKCVDIGCGTGHVTRLMGDLVGEKGKIMGIDVSQNYIDYCKKVNKKKHVEFLKGDITTSQIRLDESFDIVFSRFMFVHLENGRQALNSMIKLAKKGGKIIIQELDHAPNSWFSYPEQKSVENLRKCYVEIVKKMGGNPLVGRTLYQMFIEASLDTDMECHSPCILMGKEPYNVLGWKLAESLKSKIISFGLMTSKKYDELFNDLKKMSKDSNSFVTYARVFTVIGTKV